MRQRKQRKIPFLAHFKPEQIDRLYDTSVKTETPVSEIIREAVDAYFQRQPAPEQPTIE